MQYLLTIDQGTTSSRATLFDASGRVIKTAQRELSQYYPADGWVEHEPNEIWAGVLSTCRAVIHESAIPARQIAALGITNQRETSLLWHRTTGKALHRAIVWQDRRTAGYCESLKSTGKEAWVQAKTGLLLDPYFSATKLCWLLDHVEGARELAQSGQLAFGTVDSFLLWHLTGGRSHLTDATNASRTLLFNIHSLSWDPDLLALFDIPESLLPQIKNSCDDFGQTSHDLFGHEIPIRGIAGDQQAALIGQGCVHAGMAKSTYGTGCFLMLNSGEKALHPRHKLLTTLAYQINGRATYALEGSIFVAGAVIQWLRDGLKLISSADESEQWALRHGGSRGVYMVPAFTGLGAPHWDPDARGALLGLTRDSSIGDIVTASLQSVAYQTKDLLDAMIKDGAQLSHVLRVDGGMITNKWFVQFLADILAVEVDTPQTNESTSLGLACLAGLGAGIYTSLDDVTMLRQTGVRYYPAMPALTRDALYEGWLAALARVKS
jgi:glycerol kinase